MHRFYVIATDENGVIQREAYCSHVDDADLLEDHWINTGYAVVAVRDLQEEDG